jgi:hypothetical protein
MPDLCDAAFVLRLTELVCCAIVSRVKSKAVEPFINQGVHLSTDVKSLHVLI